MIIHTLYNNAYIGTVRIIDEVRHLDFLPPSCFIAEAGSLPGRPVNPFPAMGKSRYANAGDRFSTVSTVLIFELYNTRNLRLTVFIREHGFPDGH